MMVLTLKQARLVREMTQEQVAEILGVHVQTYRRIEQEPDEATIGQAKRISKELGLNYNEIFFGSNSSLNRETAPSTSPTT